MAALIKNASSRYVLFFPNFEFFAPDFLLDELEKYREEIHEKTKLSQDQFDKIFNDAISKVHLVPIFSYQEEIQEAEGIMSHIDNKDVPFIAVGLSLKIKEIWTEDKHFSNQKIMKVYSTHDLIQLILKHKEN
jgi:predicted nucleic acid-binding protein